MQKDIKDIITFIASKKFGKAIVSLIVWGIISAVLIEYLISASFMLGLTIGILLAVVDFMNGLNGGFSITENVMEWITE